MGERKQGLWRKEVPNWVIIIALAFLIMVFAVLWSSLSVCRVKLEPNCTCFSYQLCAAEKEAAEEEVYERFILPEGAPREYCQTLRGTWCWGRDFNIKRDFNINYCERCGKDDGKSYPCPENERIKVDNQHGCHLDWYCFKCQQPQRECVEWDECSGEGVKTSELSVRYSEEFSEWVKDISCVFTERGFGGWFAVSCLCWSDEPCAVQSQESGKE